MDEPFGALDALTRLQVRADLERLWLSERQTVLFITHSIEEAVGLSDRVVVMSPSPGRIVREMTIDLARPRPLALGETPQLEEHVQAIYGLFEEMGVLHGKSAGVRGARSAR
jgi:NitT/TauT family transport system ATP-binding protein